MTFRRKMVKRGAGLNIINHVFSINTHSLKKRDVLVSMLATSEVDRGFEPRSGQSKDYKTYLSCFSSKHAALWRKSKDWLVRN